MSNHCRDFGRVLGIISCHDRRGGELGPTLHCQWSFLFKASERSLEVALPPGDGQSSSLSGSSSCDLEWEMGNDIGYENAHDTPVGGKDPTSHKTTIIAMGWKESCINDTWGGRVTT